MKKIQFIITLLFVAVSVLTNAQQTKQLQFAPFENVFATSAIQVTIQKANEHSATITSNYLNDVELVVKDNTLHIQYKSPNNKRKRIYQPETTVIVTMPNVKAVSAESAAQVEIADRFPHSSLELTATSSSTINFAFKGKHLAIVCNSMAEINGAIAVDTLTIENTSMANVALSGTCNQLNAEGTTSSTTNLNELTCKSATLDASTAASMIAHVQNRIEATSTTGATIKYDLYGKENTYINEETSLGGSIQKIKERDDYNY